MEVMLQSDSQLPHLQQPKLNQLQQRPQQQEAAGERINNQEKGDKHLHVLAVDDSLIDRKILEQLLTVSSYHVTCVDSGDKALEFLGLVDNPPHSSSSSSSSSPSHQQGKGMQVNLIMTDFSMPGMSGYDLLKRVKGSNSWKDVPVVVMSSENVPSRIHMCLEEGAEEFLLKPVRLSDLEKLQPRISKCSGCLCRESTNSSSTDADHQANANVVVKNSSKEVMTNFIDAEDNGNSKLQGNKITSPDRTETNGPQELEQRPTLSVATTAIDEEEDMIVSPTSTSTTTTTLLNKGLDHFS